MSAWVCSELHINTVATFLAAREIKILWRPGDAQEEFEACAFPAATAQILFAENVKSVNYRYDEHDVVTAHPYRMIAPLPELVAMYKLIGCLDYQSCEHPDYDRSLASKLLAAGSAYIERQLGRTKDEIQNSAEWEKAPWAID
jgi:hypothetical protein